MSNLDDFLDDLDDIEDNTSDLLGEMNDRYGDSIDDLVGALDRFEDLYENRNDQDMVMAMQRLESYYNNDYSDPEEEEKDRKQIDIFFKRKGLDAPFENDILDTADVYDGFFKTRTRRNFLAGLAGLFGTAVVASDTGNYAEEDTPNKGGVQLPFGTGDLDGWGAAEDHRAAEGYNPGQNNTTDNQNETPTEPESTATPVGSDPYSSLPQQGERISWSEADDHLSSEDVSRINTTAQDLGLNESQGGYEFNYEGENNQGNATGYIQWVLPDDTFRSDDDDEVDIIEFDNVVYQNGN